MLGQNAACNRLHTVDTRMAKWLLMTHDSVGDGYALSRLLETSFTTSVT